MLWQFVSVGLGISAGNKVCLWSIGWKPSDVREYRLFNSMEKYCKDTLVPSIPIVDTIKPVSFTKLNYIPIQLLYSQRNINEILKLFARTIHLKSKKKLCSCVLGATYFFLPLLLPFPHPQVRPDSRWTHISWIFKVAIICIKCAR